MLLAGKPQSPTAVNDVWLPSNFQVDTSTYVILKFNTKDTWLFKSAKPTSLSNNEIQAIEGILKKCIDKHNIYQEKEYKKNSQKYPEYNFNRGDFIIDLSRYKRQYIPVINSRGEKEVWINCLCSSEWHKYWRDEIVMVMDGGNCYFNVIINMSKKTYYNLMVNGVV